MTQLSNITKAVRNGIGKHTPEILTGIGIAGLLTTTVMAVKVTPKALALIEDQDRKNKDAVQEILGNDSGVNMTPIEKVKTAWVCYIPAAVTALLSVACIIRAGSVNRKRSTALTTAYVLSESALKDYQTKIVETIGEKKARSVKDAIDKDKLDRDPVSTKEVFITEKGNTLCYDVISGRYFKSDIETLKKITNELNRQMLSDMYICLNEFYYDIGLKSTSIGDDLGWSVENGLIDLQFSSQLADDGTPCLVLDYQVAPRYDYRK